MDQQGAVSELGGVYALFMQLDKYSTETIPGSFARRADFRFSRFKNTKPGISQTEVAKVQTLLKDLYTYAVNCIILNNNFNFEKKLFDGTSSSFFQLQYGNIVGHVTRLRTMSQNNDLSFHFSIQLTHFKKIETEELKISLR